MSSVQVDAPAHSLDAISYKTQEDASASEANDNNLVIAPDAKDVSFGGISDIPEYCKKTSLNSWAKASLHIFRVSLRWASSHQFNQKLSKTSRHILLGKKVALLN